MDIPSTSRDPLHDSPQARRAVRVGRQSVIIGDCTAEMRHIPPASIDVVVTSPPYNLGIAYRGYDDRMPRPVYLDWMAEVAVAIERVLAPHGSLFLNVGASSRDPWVSFDIAAVMRRTFVLQNHMTWVKSVSIGDDTVGHFKPIKSKRYLNHNHESVFHFTKSGSVPLDRLAVGVPYKDKSNIARRGHAQDKRCAGNTWFIPYQTVQSRTEKFNHPAAFPAALAERCIGLHGRAGATVLDPFLGSGSTLVAARALGCRGIGIEVDPVYAETAIARLRALDG